MTLRPITPDELPFLVGLGRELRDLREDAGFSRDYVGMWAGLSASQLRAIEAGRRRTRRSTLERLARVLFPSIGWPDDRGPSREQVQLLTDRLCEMAGSALAPESPASVRRHRRRLERE